MKRLRAVRSLRWNYRWRGVWVWLKAPTYYRDYTDRFGPGRGWQVVWRDPDLVIRMQDALASGAYL